MRHTGRFTRIKKPLKSDMNVVPYIDVMLVLLVIFMVTAPMITSGIKVDLPEANAAAVSSNEPPAIVSLDHQGQYILQYKNYGHGQPIALEELQTLLQQAQQDANTQNQQFTVVINGEKTRPYGEIIRLMDHLQQAGLNKVALLTEPLK